MIRCLLTAEVDAIGLDRLIEAGVEPTDLGEGESFNASDLGLEVDEAAAARLHDDIVACWPDPLTSVVTALHSMDGAIAPGFEDTFEACFREAVSAEQIVADTVADFIEPVRDDRVSDLALFACSGIADD